MSNINGDLRVQGDVENWLNLMTFADFDNSGLTELIICVHGYPSEIVFYLDAKFVLTNNRIDLIYDQPDISIMINRIFPLGEGTPAVKQLL